MDEAAATKEPVVVLVRWSKNAVDAAVVAVVLVVLNAAADDGSICWEEDRRNARRQDLEICISQ